MKLKHLIQSFLLTAIVGWLPATTVADDASATQACPCETCKVCKLVKKEKKVTVTCYGSKCKDICIPHKGCKGELITDCVPAGKESCESSRGIAKITYSTDEPGEGRIRTIHQLVKYEVTKKIPVYEWVVVEADRCPAEPKR